MIKVLTGNSKVTRRFRRGLGALALLIGLIGAATIAAPRTHATRATRFWPPYCYACKLFAPNIQVTSYDYPTGTMGISGSNFTPGGAVHLDVLELEMGATAVPGGQQQPDYYQSVAQTDTAATLALTLPLGNGQFVTIPGGQVTATMTIPVQFSGCPSPITFQVVATDEATGLSANTTATESCS